MVGLGHDLTRFQLAVELPQFAENNDWRVAAAGRFAQIGRGRAGCGGIAVGIEQNEIGLQICEQDEVPARAPRLRSWLPRDSSSNIRRHFARFARGIDNQHAGREFHASDLQCESEELRTLRRAMSRRGEEYRETMLVSKAIGIVRVSVVCRCGRTGPDQHCKRDNEQMELTEKRPQLAFTRYALLARIRPAFSDRLFPALRRGVPGAVCSSTCRGINLALITNGHGRPPYRKECYVKTLSLTQLPSLARKPCWRWPPPMALTTFGLRSFRPSAANAGVNPPVRTLRSTTSPSSTSATSSRSTNASRRRWSR